MTKILIDEATVKLALEALEYIEHNYMSLPAPAEKAITALREALTSVPDWASEAIEQPAPVAKPHEQEPFGFAVMENPIAPPAQRTWVGLTDEEVHALWMTGEANIAEEHHSVVAYEIEAKLREKNT